MQITARGLTKLYGDLPAVHGLDLDIASGEFLALLGRNGAGKSTLLKMLALLTRPSGGELVIGDAEERLHPESLKRRIGLLAHNTFLYDDLTASENLHFYCSIYGIEDAETVCLNALDTVGLRSFSNELVRNFSRGMRQRLTIGRLFLHDPDLLLLDEPFNGLDDRAVGLLEDQLIEAKNRGKTIVLCTHQIDLALKFASRLLILHRGKAAYVGENQPGQSVQMQELYRRYAG